jgi:hypothetical protein
MGTSCSTHRQRFQKRYCYSLTAPTGYGKTALLLTIATHVAIGKPIGSIPVKQGRVLYLAGENPDDVISRWMVQCEKMGLDPRALDIRIIPCSFAIHKEVRKIAKEAEATGPYDLVVVDTSQSYFSGDDDNSNVQTKKHADTLRKLTRISGRPCVIVACHPSKTSPEVPRGGSAFLNEIDGNVYLKLDAPHVTMKRHTKFRGPPWNPVVFGLKEEQSDTLHDAWGEMVTSVRAIPLDTSATDSTPKADADQIDARLLKAIAAKPGQSLQWYADCLGGGVTKHNVRHARDRLKKAGSVWLKAGQPYPHEKTHVHERENQSNAVDGEGEL